MLEEKPVRQHTVPSNYLRFFSDDNKGRESKLYGFDIQTKKGRIDIAGNISIEKDFYTLYNEDGSKNYEIEKILGEIDTIPSIIEKIDRQEILNKEELRNIGIFVVVQEMRSKSRRNRDNQNIMKIIKSGLNQIYYNLDTYTDRKKSLEKFLIENFPGTIKYNDIDEILKKYETGESFIINDKGGHISSMLELFPQMLQFVMNRAWTILIAPPKRSFITSDYPLYLHADNGGYLGGVGYGTADEIYFPLSKKSYLIASASWKLDKLYQKNTEELKNIYSKIDDPKMIRLFNGYTAYGTDRYIIGNSEKIIKSIHEYVLKADQEYHKFNNKL